MKLKLISEATINQTQQRIPIWINKYFNGNQQTALNLIPQIIEADPTNGKYSEWLIRQWKNKTVRFPEDTEKLSKNLQLFDKKKSKLTEKDINRYTPATLSETLEQELGLTKSERKDARRGGMQLPPGAIEIGSYNMQSEDNNQGDEDDWLVYGSNDSGGSATVVKITDAKASTLLCSGTEWCVANPDTATSYLEQGPLYLFFVDGKRKFLFHLPTQQMMDIHDNNVDSRIKREMLLAVNSLDPKHLSDNPLETIQVASNNRILHKIATAEFIKNSKIFEDGADPETTYTIMNKLGPVYNDDRSIIKKAYENFLIRTEDIKHMRRYHFNSSLKKWPEAEPLIAKDPVYAADYAAFHKERFPEAEEAIKKNPQAALTYCIDVLDSRWPDAEPYIKQSNFHWSKYLQYAKWWETAAEDEADNFGKVPLDQWLRSSG